MKHKHTEEDNAHDADTDDDDSKDIKKENNTNLSTTCNGFGHFSCLRVWSSTLC